MWGPRWAVLAEAFGVKLVELVLVVVCVCVRVCLGVEGGGRMRLTDLPWAVANASERDLPPNHLQETGVWEDNYKYSCQRRHVSIDALE